MSRKTVIFWFIILPDILLLYASLWIAVVLRYGADTSLVNWPAHLQAFSVVFALWLLIFFIHNLFEVSTFRRYTILLRNLFAAMVINGLVAVLYFYVQPDLILTPRRLLLIAVLVASVLVLGWHLLVKYFLKNRLIEHVYVFAFSDEPKELLEEIARHDFLGYKVVASLTEDSLATTEILRNSGVIVPDNISTTPAILGRLYELRKKGVAFYSHAYFYEQLLRKVYLSRVSELWFLENVSYKHKRFYSLAKRCVDTLAGLLGLIIFGLSFPVCALLVRLSSSGPILFIQERVGEGGKLFKVYKYRTMTGPITNTWTAIHDPRITPIGRFLRASRIDELPQCINLLLGNMSLVGPRPEQVHLVEQLRALVPFYDERHLVKPGITGWAQINNTYAATVAETEDKLQYDLYYIKHRSFLFDLEIMLKTIYYVLSWQGR